MRVRPLPGDEQRCLAAGCDDYETNPADLRRLIENVQALLTAD